MIGVARQDRSGSIQLFHQNDARQAVRKCQRAERKFQRGSIQCRSAVSIGAADEKDARIRAFVTRGPHERGERFARE